MGQRRQLDVREWDGPAVLPLPNGSRSWWGLQKHEDHIATSCKTDTVVARTIGIDTGKNTLHPIGLDDKGAIVLREKVSRGRIAARLANVPQCLIGIEASMATHYLRGPRADIARS